MTKPMVNTNPFANQGTGPDEQIIAYSSRNGGGLIAFREADDGHLIVDLYRHDSTVEVRVGPPEGIPARPTQVLVTLDDGRQVGMISADAYHVRNSPGSAWDLPLPVSKTPHERGTVYFGSW